VLERLNRLKSEFLTRISHQFRTALVGIQGFSEVIRDSEQLDPGELKAFASDIYKDAERLDRAFSEMVELDRIETGRAILKIARVDINELVDGVIEATRNESPEHTLAARLDRSVPVVSCDRDKVSQVLAILLSNAVKYSPAGTEVEVRSQATADSVEVTVQDHGPGMPPDFDDGLFVGYQRQPLNGANRMSRGGATGVGLPIARQIVEMHGGRIWFDSTVGQGTEFHFTLRLQVSPSAEPKAAAAAGNL